jgi:hypothetical protein
MSAPQKNVTEENVSVENSPRETNPSFTYDKRHHDEDWRPADSGDFPLSPNPYESSESGPWHQGEPSEPVPDVDKGKWAESQGSNLTALVRQYPVASLAIGATLGGLLGVAFAKQL